MSLISGKQKDDHANDMRMNDLKCYIVKSALDLGFIRIGFTQATPLVNVEELLRQRLKEGKLTPFEEQDIRLRINPKAVWPPCETVVVLAYPIPLSSNPNPNEGILARSAVGEDYHRVLRKKLERLIQELMQIYHFKHPPQYQVDTGSLNERGFAVRAGIGWIGKNQQLLVPGYGSFVALALLLLDVELLVDEPLPDQCGTCSQCVKACPAGILEENCFDPRRCLSYLTQQKEILSPKQSAILQGRVFGCDSCQEACPHNQKRLREEEEGKHELHRGVNLQEVLNLTNGEFSQRYRTTAAGWRGKGTLQRNAFLALKNGKASSEFNLEEWVKERTQTQNVPEAVKPYLKNP